MSCGGAPPAAAARRALGLSSRAPPVLGPAACSSSTSSCNGSWATGAAGEDGGANRLAPASPPWASRPRVPHSKATVVPWSDFDVVCPFCRHLGFCLSVFISVAAGIREMDGAYSMKKILCSLWSLIHKTFVTNTPILQPGTFLNHALSNTHHFSRALWLALSHFLRATAFERRITVLHHRRLLAGATVIVIPSDGPTRPTSHRSLPLDV